MGGAVLGTALRPNIITTQSKLSTGIKPQEFGGTRNHQFKINFNAKKKVKTKTPEVISRWVLDLS